MYGVLIAVWNIWTDQLIVTKWSWNGVHPRSVTFILMNRNEARVWKHDTYRISLIPSRLSDFVQVLVKAWLLVHFSQRHKEEVCPSYWIFIMGEALIKALATEIPAFLNDSSKQRTRRNPESNKRQMALNEARLLCQLLMWTESGCVERGRGSPTLTPVPGCPPTPPPFYFTQAVFSPPSPSCLSGPGYWEGYISRARVDGWRDGWSEEEESRAVGQLTSRPLLHNNSLRAVHSAHTQPPSPPRSSN